MKIVKIVGYCVWYEVYSRSRLAVTLYEPLFCRLLLFGANLKILRETFVARYTYDLDAFPKSWSTFRYQASLILEIVKTLVKLKFKILRDYLMPFTL